MKVVFLISVVLHSASPGTPPARNIKIVRMDPWEGAEFAGTTISATEKGGAPFELMECFDICRDMEDCGAFWIGVKYRQ